MFLETLFLNLEITYIIIPIRNSDSPYNFDLRLLFLGKKCFSIEMPVEVMVRVLGSQKTV